MDPLTAQVMQPGIHWAGLLRPESLHLKARELFKRYQPRVPFGLTVVELPRLKPRLVRGEDVRWEHLAATASIPMAFPPVGILGRHYIDGGFPAGALPLWAAREMGAARAVAVMCLTSLPFRVMRRILPTHQDPGNMEVIRFEPSEPLGSLRDAIVWSAANIRRWIDLGERDANRALLSITM